MPNYKAPDNSLHFIEPEFAHLLPTGSVQITDEEAKALRPVPPPPDYSAMRAAAYITESDPLFFKEQRGEVEAGTWLAKVNEIKARWPQ